MLRYTVFHPDHEMIGVSIADYKHAVRGEEVHEYFAGHGLAHPDPDTWYPLQTLLDVFNDLNARGGAMFDFISVGMNVIENMVLPPNIESIPAVEIFQMADVIYKMNNRGSNIGGLTCDVVNDHSIIMTYITPLPDHLWYGIAYGFARRLLPKGTHITAYFDEHVVQRDEGGEKTVIHIKWD